MVFTGYEHAHQCTVAVGAVRSSSQTTAGVFERRKLGDIQSRFDSLDTLRATFTTSVIGFIMDSIMVVGVCVMMLLYGGYLTWIVLCFTTIYIFIRLVTYGNYRQISEECLVREARAASYFMETLYGIATVKIQGWSEFGGTLA